ncbi:hypothetical protein BCR33DRAFT_12910 [Rhizoclosmatium globosum]|uniref:L domain-like protein n=1 Tax=Rhizoclosmatium globosum TaxID=329046 RepID=A0A1Y2CPF8_9FUNG|nr:hypothetical protein BCR33DRAFT_12910 [Rhizoclosmatium globosum]|eukprot:ORY48883.1 hypothetical protein BCR33DRAFT_12910 [Rhizoclosmatium globosum]
MSDCTLLKQGFQAFSALTALIGDCSNSNYFSNDLGGRLTKIDLMGAMWANNLQHTITTTIPTQIGSLDQLRYLNLASFGLSGAIPDNLFTLPLTSLYLGIMLSTLRFQPN